MDRAVADVITVVPQTDQPRSAQPSNGQTGTRQRRGGLENHDDLGGLSSLVWQARDQDLPISRDDLLHLYRFHLEDPQAAGRWLHGLPHHSPRRSPARTRLPIARMNPEVLPAGAGTERRARPHAGRRHGAPGAPAAPGTWLREAVGGRDIDARRVERRHRRPPPRANDGSLDASRPDSVHSPLSAPRTGRRVLAAQDATNGPALSSAPFGRLVSRGS